MTFSANTYKNRAKSVPNAKTDIHAWKTDKKTSFIQIKVCCTDKM